MKKFDEVALKYEITALAEKGIHKGCYGDVIDVASGMCKVIFYAPRIFGNFAVATVDESALVYMSHMDEGLIEGFKKFVETLDESKHTCFLDDDVHEYDVIEMTVEKEKYAKHGVHKGMTGVVMEDTSYYNEWYVIFSDQNGEDIADMSIHRDDFKIIHRGKREDN